MLPFCCICCLTVCLFGEHAGTPKVGKTMRTENSVGRQTCIGVKHASVQYVRDVTCCQAQQKPCSIMHGAWRNGNNISKVALGMCRGNPVFPFF